MMRFSSTALVGLFLCGCTGGASDKQVSVYAVTGKVTLSGSPVPSAVVTYSPKGEQPVAIGRTGPDGVYTLTTYEASDGAAPGEYDVLIIKNAPAAAASGPPAHGVNAAPTPVAASHSGPKGKKNMADSESILPARYGDRGKSGLSATVTKDAAKNKFDFELSP